MSGHIPNHIAIIMDGNRRWADARHLPCAMGHRKGAERAADMVDWCLERGIDYLTLFVFSAENWSRPQDEVQDLMNLLRGYLKQERKNMRKKQVRVRFLGDSTPLADDVKEQMHALEDDTASYDRMNLQLALSYGGRQEIISAVQKLAQQSADGSLDPSAINEHTMDEALTTRGIPNPDLLIRTGGDQRISNFLLWQMAYTELFFTEALWPDMSETILDEAIADFQKRERRFGGRLSKEASHAA